MTAAETRQRRSTPARLLLGRRVLSQQVTSAALLAGIIVGAVIGAIAGSWLAGVWIGLVFGWAIPRVVAVWLDLTGRLPAWALYRSRPG